CDQGRPLYNVDPPQSSLLSSSRLAHIVPQRSPTESFDGSPARRLGVIRTMHRCDGDFVRPALFFLATALHTAAVFSAPGVPKIHEFRFPTDLSVGETVVVNCVVRKGSAGPFQLSWRKDGGPIDPAEGVSVSHQSDAISTLTVRHVAPTHNGNYSCHVRNAAGSDEYAAFLAVRAAPVWSA
ncbi:unnamed protein product, partial [Ixodes pacificus]